MTYIIIGYPDARAKGPPVLVHLGTSRSEAMAALNAATPGVARAHLHVDPLPSRIKRARTPQATAPMPQAPPEPAPPAPQPEPPTEKPLELPAKKRNSPAKEE